MTTICNNEIDNNQSKITKSVSESVLRVLCVCVALGPSVKCISDSGWQSGQFESLCPREVCRVRRIQGYTSQHFVKNWRQQTLSRGKCTHKFIQRNMI